MLGKIDALKKVMDGTGGWFDETGTLKVENQIKGAIRELENIILEIDINLMKLAKSQQEREQRGTSEPKPERDGKRRLVPQ